MKQTKLPIYLMLLAALSASSCSNEDTPDTPYNPSNDPDAVELGITAGVALTKSAINSGTQSGTGSDVMHELAVYAFGSGDSYKDGSNNNYAIYKQSDNEGWANNESSKIYLTGEVATIYAFYPAHKYNQYGTATSDILKWVNTGTNATVAISVFEGGTDAANNLKTNSIIPDTDNSNNGKILSAPGDVDYMWAYQTPAVQASNGKGDDDATGKSISLNMHHALSMISFRIYNDGTYKNKGTLTKIKLENSSGSTLAKSTDATMNITTGVVTSGTTSAATYVRLIGSDAGVTIGNNKDNAHKYSMLVLPETTSSDKSKIKATFTIDNVDYPVNISGTSQWKAGENNLYTAVLKGVGLEITTVTVETWGTGSGGGDLNVQ